MLRSLLWICCCLALLPPSLSLRAQQVASPPAAKHWAYQAPTRPSLPSDGLRNAHWPRNAIDCFVLSTLQTASLEPSPAADKRRLVRRITLTLTGLPPTPSEVEAFLADHSPDAYERLVDRLLQSPRYGERMATWWLDLARYADTHGYHIDSHRDMWRWRDWVINAFNQNMPFDRFTIEQLAGDLLPEPTLQQKIATGFNRNNMINFEGGAIAEEYLTEYIADRVVTTSTVWMGQTMECARCHDHKYDPFTQREFYELYAFFNSVPENGLDGRTGNAEPFIKAPTQAQQRQLKELDCQLAELEASLQQRAAASVHDQAQWEQQLRAGDAEIPEPPADTAIYFPLNETEGDVASSGDGSQTAHVRGNAIWVPGKFAGALLLDGQTRLETNAVADLERTGSFSCGAWIFPTTTDLMAVFSRAQQESKRGYELLLREGKLHAHLLHEGEEKSIHVCTHEPLQTSKWQHVMMTYDGSSKAAGVLLYVDGVLQELEVIRDSLTASIKTASEKPLCIGRRQDSAGFRGMLDDVRLYQRRLEPEEVALLAGSNPILEIAAIAPEERTEKQQRTLQRYFLEHEDSRYMQLKIHFDEAQRDRDQLWESVPTTMVMKELDQPRETFVLLRGDYRASGEKVSPATPAALPPMPAGAPRNRLGLAQWLVAPEHPLTARVVVNHLWQIHFGSGLVRTPEDFGTRGELPSHPELLDWLAVELVHSGWDLKHMHRLIATSATFRQSSFLRAELLQLDPENRLLARGPRYRLHAEAVRDQALAVAGLLEGPLGGPSVYPYQPAGLWEEISYNPDEYSAQRYLQSSGEALYRRSLYTFWKRTAPPPAMLAFDAPSRETCTTSRSRTNTPLQALVLMNDPTYVEAARCLAERLMAEEGEDAADRIRYALLLTTAREPSSLELQSLLDLYQQQKTSFENDRAAAAQLLSVGELPRNEQLDQVELAALTTVASILLCLDEVISVH